MTIQQELESWEHLIFDNLDLFIQDVIGKDVMEVYEVSWDCSTLYYTYIEESGQHLASSITMAAWLKLKDKYE